MFASYSFLHFRIIIWDNFLLPKIHFSVLTTKSWFCLLDIFFSNFYSWFFFQQRIRNGDLFSFSMLTVSVHYLALLSSRSLLFSVCLSFEVNIFLFCFFKISKIFLLVFDGAHFHNNVSKFNLESSGLLNLHTVIFQKFWKVICHCLFRYCLYPILSSCLWDPE